MDLNDLCMACMTNKGSVDVCPVCEEKAVESAESPLQLPPGTILNEQYMLGSVLGQGGFGITYIAWDIELERKVAVKEYFPHSIAVRSDSTEVSIYGGKYADDYQFGLERFFSEGKTLARFQEHPGIVSVFSAFKANGTGYIVMEYVEGITFKEYLDKEGGKIDFDTAVKILIPVMDALREVHNSKLMHRDISPDNIYLTEKNQVKLLDFGSARYTLGERSENYSVILKPGYAPEEQYKTRGNQGAWTDIYSLGAVLYRAVAGEIPPDALDRLDDDIIKPLSEFAVEVSKEKEAILMKALAVRANNRYQNMETFQEELAPEVAKEKKARDDKKHVKRASRGWIAATVIFCLSSILCLIGWIATEQRVVRINGKLSDEEYKNYNLKENVSDLEGKLKIVSEKFDDERKIRTLIAGDFPVKVGKIQLRNELNGESLSGFRHYFFKSTIRYLHVYVEVRNNWSGIKKLKGEMFLSIYKPDGILDDSILSPKGYSTSEKISIDESGIVHFSWGNKSGGSYRAGSHNVEIWWEGKLIGKTSFRVYE